MGSCEITRALWHQQARVPIEPIPLAVEDVLVSLDELFGQLVVTRFSASSPVLPTSSRSSTRKRLVFYVRIEPLRKGAEDKGVISVVN